MTTKIATWGNSLGVRLPKEVARMFNLSAGKSVVVKAGKSAITIQPIEKEETFDELVKKITTKNRHEELFSDISPVGKEIW